MKRLSTIPVDRRSSKDLKVITEFIASLGIDVITEEFAGLSFLPGIRIENGCLLVNPDLLVSPGDLLHEAGHLAVMTRKDRESCPWNAGNSKTSQQAAGEEMAAIAWSYAAAVYLGVDAEVVFHPQGYNGDSEWLLGVFVGNPGSAVLGVPMLQWMGMCLDSRQASERGGLPYPHMLKWLRD